MKRFTVILLALLLISGCSAPARGKRAVLAKINNYSITQEEFEQAFRDSVFGMSDTLESRKKFLDILISQKLILQEAQKQGLDRDESFLKSIEKFWEQSLLKIALDKKTKEISSSVYVGDKEIEDAYQKLVAEGKADKPYQEMYGQLKWEFNKTKESDELNRWISNLQNRARIKINYDLLRAGK